MRFAVFLFLVLTGFAHAEDRVSLLFRGLVDAPRVYNHVLANPNGVWPELEALQRETGRLPYDQLNGDLAYRVFKALMMNPRSWGHVAVEIRTADRVVRLGWEPLANEEQIRAMAESLGLTGSAAGRMVVPGRFLDANDWLDDPNNPTPVSRIDIADIPKNLIVNLTLEIALMDSDPRWSYQLGSMCRGEFEPFAVNCITAMKRIFERSGLPLDFLPDTGSISTMNYNIEQLLRLNALVPVGPMPCSMLLLDGKLFSTDENSLW